jgi:hypothetical protein
MSGRIMLDWFKSWFISAFTKVQMYGGSNTFSFGYIDSFAVMLKQKRTLLQKDHRCKLLVLYRDFILALTRFFLLPGLLDWVVVETIYLNTSLSSLWTRSASCFPSLWRWYHTFTRSRYSWAFAELLREKKRRQDSWAERGRGTKDKCNWRRSRKGNYGAKL